MEELSSVMNNVARLVAVIGGGLSTICFCYAGIQWMTASGDPQKMGQARMALMGAMGGLIIVGIAFIAPRVISQMIIEPVGGVDINTDVGTNCDQILKNQLVFQRGASTADNMNVVIRQIQAQRDSCALETWTPKVMDHDDAGVKQPQGSEESCFGSDATVDNTDAGKKAWERMAVGDTRVPRGLHEQNNVEKKIRKTSGRDSDNNILVYWDDEKRPTDDAKCWLYVDRLRVWDENY